MSKFIYLITLILVSKSAWSYPNYFHSTMTSKCNKNNARFSCLEHYKAGCKDDGYYTLKYNDNSSSLAYCDQTRDGGGWTLVVAQTNSTYVPMLKRGSNSITLTSNEGHSKIEEIYSRATESRWTDSSFNRFMQFSVYASQTTTSPVALSAFSNAVINTACSSTSTLWIKFSNGYLNTGTNARKVEACRANTVSGVPVMYFGFRNNTDYAGIKDIRNNTTTHECWHDENAFDRIFAVHGDPISYGHCDQFGYNWSGTGAGRNGTMNYYIWSR